MIAEQTLLEIYLATLERAAPQRLISERLMQNDLSALRQVEVDLVAIGKCAAGLAEGAMSILNVRRSIVVVPSGYSREVSAQRGEDVEVVEGSHPEISEESYRAGDRLCEFVARASRPIVFVVSGGSSACVERPLHPWFDENDLAVANRTLIRSGLAIASINLVRRRLSAIKGGRLGALAPRGSLTLVFSDVSRGRLEDVGSGPTLPDSGTKENAAAILESLGDESCAKLAKRLRRIPEETPLSNASTAYLIADNSTLREIASDEAGMRGLDVVACDDDVEGTVDDLAPWLAERAGALRPDSILVAGGEPTVIVRGGGTGGRCSELAVRFAVDCNAAGLACVALFASSDGLDGNSGAAGILLATSFIEPSAVARALATSDTFPLAAEAGTAVYTGATGNNLRDLYLVARN